MTRGAALALGRILTVTLLTFASPAFAQSSGEGPPLEARRHFEAGTEAFDIGDYERAAAEFRLAYELRPHADLLYNIYSALERAGQVQEAADALEGYLRDGDPDDDRRTSLQARLARLRERLAEARAQQAEADLQAERDAGRSAPPPPDPPAPAPAPPPGGVHPAGVGVLVAGGALLVSFAVFAGLAAAENGNLEGSCSPACSDDQVSTLAAFSLVADISWIAGAVAATTGLILLLVLPPEGETATAAVAPFVTPNAAGLSAVGRF